MRIFISILAILFCLLISTITSATELPPPPDGYKWAEFPEIKGAFLQPKGWHLKKLQKEDTYGYFITKENIDHKGSFITGLTINVIRNFTVKSGAAPSKYAASLISEGASSKKVLKEPWSRTMGPFSSHGVVLLNLDSKLGDYITHNLAIGNDTTGTLYIITFEGLAKAWETTWAIGEPMLKFFMIDTDI